MSTSIDWIIIGAGVAGCRMASLLTQQGYEVLILEKSRGLGGRLCHKRTESGRFLHGAQYIHLRTELGRQVLSPWLTEPHSTLLPKLGVQDSTGNWSAAFDAHRHRFFPETSIFCKSWTSQSTIHKQTRVTNIQRTLDGWNVFTQDASFQAKNLVSAIPFSQLMELLPENIISEVQDSIDVTETPSCSVLFRTEKPHVVHNDWDNAIFPDSIVRGLFQQPRSDGQHWTSILDSGWVVNNWKKDAHTVLHKTLIELNQLIGWSLTPMEIRWSHIHWWRYGFSQNTLLKKQYFSNHHLCIVGDGMYPQAKGIEAAILSAEQAILEVPLIRPTL